MRQSTQIDERLAEECRAEDAAFDDEFTRVRNLLAELRQRPQPDHAQARKHRDGALGEAERQLDADLEALFLQYGVNDNRYN